MDAPLLELLRARFGDEAVSASSATDPLALSVRREDVRGTVAALKRDLHFDLFLDVTAVDWLDRVPRFDVVYHFYSTTSFLRVRVTTHVGLEDCAVDSVSDLYSAAIVMERECHEMYGIVFRGHPDLRPMLLYEGFVGHPLRKDYAIDAEQPLVPYRK